MTYRIVSGPASEPVTLAEACEWLKLSVGDDDNVVNALIKAARERAEHYTGRHLLTKQIEQYFDCFPVGRVIDLGLWPVFGAAITVSYLAVAGTTYTVFADTNYTADRYSNPARIVLGEYKTWPVAANEANAIKLTYSVGDASAADVMETIKTGMRLLIGFWYENREDINTRKNPAEMRSADACFFAAKVFF
jgi:uncharacterized phiE125 gp8 family phage protein